jgi:excisionase family DNA binding protein
MYVWKYTPNRCIQSLPRGAPELDRQMLAKPSHEMTHPAEAGSGVPPIPANQDAHHLNDPILTIQDAAADLSVSRRTIYDWVHKGLIEPPQKLGPRRVGYLRSTIERFKATRPLAFQPSRR